MSFLEAAVKQEVVSSRERIYKFREWKYPEVAELLKVDDEFQPLRQIVKTAEISGKQLLDCLELQTLPLWCKSISKPAWQKLRGLCCEIENVLAGPPPECIPGDESPPVRRRSLSVLKSINRRSIPHRPSLDGEGPLDQFVTRTEDDLPRRKAKIAAVGYHGQSIVDRRRAKLISAKTRKSISDRPAILSYSSGVNKPEFQKWVEDCCDALTENGGIAVEWENQKSRAKGDKQVDSSQTTRNPENAIGNNKCIKFMREPKHPERIKYLVISDDQKRPTLKILYMLASGGYILDSSFITQAALNKKWPCPDQHQHKDWLTVSERMEKRCPLESLKIATIGDFKKPSISKEDLIKLISLSGGSYRSSRNSIQSSDIVIVSEGLKMADIKLLPTHHLSSGIERKGLCTNQYCKSAGFGNTHRLPSCCDNRAHPPFLVTVLWLIESLRTSEAQDTLKFEPVVCRSTKSSPERPGGVLSSGKRSDRVTVKPSSSNSRPARGKRKMVDDDNDEISTDVLSGGSTSQDQQRKRRRKEEMEEKRNEETSQGNSKTEEDYEEDGYEDEDYDVEERKEVDSWLATQQTEPEEEERRCLLGNERQSDVIDDSPIDLKALDKRSMLRRKKIRT